MLVVFGLALTVRTVRLYTVLFHLLGRGADTMTPVTIYDWLTACLFDQGFLGGGGRGVLQVISLCYK